MTATNPHPLANPFNTLKYCNFNVNSAIDKRYINLSHNPKTLTVPQSQYSYEDVLNMQKQLTVPYQDDLPDGDTTGRMGFLNDSLFRCADGSVINMHTKKIVYDPNSKCKQNGYWTDPNDTIKRSSDSTWETTPSIESILNNADKFKDGYDPNLSEYDLAYWKKSKDESEKLKLNMSDEQQQLLNGVNHGEFFPLSKLKDEYEI